MNYDTHLDYLQEQYYDKHLPECDEAQLEECICLEIIERRLADDADSRYKELEEYEL